KSRASRRREDCHLGLLLEAVAERQKTAEQIATIHGRNVSRLKRPQCAGIVPVVEMPMKPIQLVEGEKRLFQAVQESRQTQIAEMGGGKAGQKIQADIGGRRTVSYLILGVLLIIVRRQPVVLLADKGFEEVPGLAGEPLELAMVLASQVRFRGSARTTSPER